MVTTADRDEGRHTMPAGHVIVVVAICLALATFLNAASLERTAKRQPLGWKRDVLVSLIKPVRAVSRATGVGATHDTLRAALGPNTGGEPVGPRFEPARTPASHAPEAGARGAPQTAPLTSDTDLPVRTWVVGDSLAGDVGPPLFDVGRGTVTGWLDFRIGTGLSRPDLFDWPKYIRSGAADLQPRAVVMVFGGNDDKDMQSGDSGRLSFGTPEWQAEYRRRVGAVMDGLAGRDVYWVGQPIMRSATLSARLAVINRLAEEEAHEHANVIYVDGWTPLTDSAGHYAAFLPDASGELRQVRTPDGVHLTRAGSERLARVVLQAMKDRQASGAVPP